MNAHARIELNQAFVINSRDVEKIVALPAVQNGEVEIEARCQDDLTRHFADFGALAIYGDPPLGRTGNLLIKSLYDKVFRRAVACCSVRLAHLKPPNSTVRHATYVHILCTYLKKMSGDYAATD